MTAPRDHIASDLRASMALADGANDNDRREKLVIEALWAVIHYDTCPVLRAAAKARYLELSDGKPLK